MSRIGPDWIGLIQMACHLMVGTLSVIRGFDSRAIVKIAANKADTRFDAWIF